MRAANEHIDTMYGWAWANTTCARIHVLPDPAIIVGYEAGDDYVNAAGFMGGREGVAAIWDDLLRGYGLDPLPEHYGWNYVYVARNAA
jgi:hypothetical protein